MYIYTYTYIYICIYIYIYIYIMENISYQHTTLPFLIKSGVCYKFDVFCSILNEMKKNQLVREMC